MDFEPRELLISESGGEKVAETESLSRPSSGE